MASYEAVKAAFEAGLSEALAAPTAEKAHEILRVRIDDAASPVTVEHKLVLELVFRRHLDVLVRRDSTESPVDEAAEHVMDLSTWCTKQGYLDTSAPFQLFEDLFESRPLQECERLFSLLESRVEFLSAEATAQRGKLRLLRLCNELLRRLSRTTNTSFCGRVLMFLAAALPLSERSGVNLKGAINMATRTEWEQGGDTKIETPGVIDQESGQDGTTAEATAITTTTSTMSSSAAAGGPASGEPVEAIDWVFYRTFWHLQTYLRAPAQALAEFQEFSEGVRVVLKVFGDHQFSDLDTYRKSVPLRSTLTTGGDVAGAGAGRNTGSGGDAGADEMDGMPSVKYLSSSKLINLQLNDPYFRRHFLVQLLIFLRQLIAVLERKASEDREARKKAQTLIERARERVRERERDRSERGARDTTMTAGVPAQAVQQMAQRDKDLKETEERFKAVIQLRSSATDMLAQTPPNGSVFAAHVTRVLRNEDHWDQWKRDGCKPMEGEAIRAGKSGGPSASTARAVRPAKRVRTASWTGGDAHIGTGVGIEELWNKLDEETGLRDNLGDLREPLSRPTVRQYLRPLIREIQDPEAADMEEEYLLKNNKVFAWKGLRLMARERLDYFSAVKETSLEMAAREYAKEEKGEGGTEGAADVEAEKGDAPTSGAGTATA